MSPISIDILEVAISLGARLKRQGREHVGACLICGGRDRFAINPARRLWNCRGCGRGGDALDLVRHVEGVGFHEAKRIVTGELAPPKLHRERLAPHPSPAEADENDAKRIADAVALFKASIDPRGTPAETYFASRRLEITDLAGRVLRWNPRIGAAVALFRNIQSGKPQAVTRIFLDAKAEKIERKFTGPVGGAAVMLDGFHDVTQGLHVGEGVETCQTARQLGLRPCWALGSKGAIGKFPVLAGVECLTILAENDGKSEGDVETCATRWHSAGRMVLINRAVGGKDLNDAIRGGGMNAKPQPFTTEIFRPKSAPVEKHAQPCKTSLGPPAKAPTLRFKMFADIEAEPRKQYIVDGLLGEGEMSAFAGAPGSAKSALGGDLGCHLSAGMDWMGHRVRRPLAVLIIAAERAKLTERRCAAWAKKHGIRNLPLAVISGSADFFHSRDHVNEVLTYAKQLTAATGLPVGLIEIDTVSRTLAGGDENSPKDMGAYVANITALQHESGAHVLAIHHVPQGSGTDIRLRGHGALLGAVDTMITLEKSGDFRLATVAKENDGIEGRTFAFTLESVDLHVDEEGFVTTAPVVVPVDPPPTASKGKQAGRPRQLTKADKTALRALDKALSEVGAPPPASNHIPRRPRRHQDQWRKYAYQMGISASSEDRALQQAFKRAYDALLGDEHISVWGDYCWPTRKTA